MRNSIVFFFETDFFYPVFLSPNQSSDVASVGKDN